MEIFLISCDGYLWERAYTSLNDAKKEFEKLNKEYKKHCNKYDVICTNCPYSGHRNCMVLWLLDNNYLVSKGNGVLK